MDFDEYKKKPDSSRKLLYQQVQEQSNICDVTLQVGQWQKRFHWCVLVLSPFFENIQRNDFIEKQTGVVKLSLATPLTVETAILFLYGKKPNLTGDNVVSILGLSEFLMIPSLKSACVAFIKSDTITRENCMQMLEVSSLYNFEHSKCYDFIKGHLAEIFLRSEARCLTKKSVITLLDDPLLSYVTAEERFTFAVAWANACQKNKECFSEVFQSIQLANVSAEFLDTIVLQHPLVKEIGYIHNLPMADTLEEHTVLIFSGLLRNERMVCFDMDNDSWHGIEVGLPMDMSDRTFVSKYSIDGVQGLSTIYRVAKTYNSCKVAIQDLRSSASYISTVSAEETTGPHEFSTYCCGEKTFVAFSNKRTVRRHPSATKPRLSLAAMDMLFGAASSDQMTLQWARHLESQMRTDVQNIQIKSSTLFCGQLQNPQTELVPILTLLNTTVTVSCISDNQCIAMFDDDIPKLHIYDSSNCELDTIPLEDYLIPTERYSRNQVSLVKYDNGYILYNDKMAICISRLNGPTLTNKYHVQKHDLEHSREWKGVSYLFCSKTWFRFVRKSYENKDVAFSYTTHDELVLGNREDTFWKPLPVFAGLFDRFSISDIKHIFKLKLPRSMLNCHYNCPHCEQRREEERSTASRLTPRHVLADDDVFYDDSDEDSDYNYGHAYYDTSDDDYYYYSSD